MIKIFSGVHIDFQQLGKVERFIKYNKNCILKVIFNKELFILWVYLEIEIMLGGPKPMLARWVIHKLVHRLKHVRHFFTSFIGLGVGKHYTLLYNMFIPRIQGGRILNSTFFLFKKKNHGIFCKLLFCYCVLGIIDMIQNILNLKTFEFSFTRNSHTNP